MHMMSDEHKPRLVSSSRKWNPASCTDGRWILGKSIMITAVDTGRGATLQRVPSGPLPAFCVGPCHPDGSNIVTAAGPGGVHNYVDNHRPSSGVGNPADFRPGYPVTQELLLRAQEHTPIGWCAKAGWLGQRSMRLARDAP
jgi:hypothetical protein